MTIQSPKFMQHLFPRMLPLAAALAVASAALLLTACGEAPKMGASGSGSSSGSAPASTSAPKPMPAPMDGASAPKQ